ncbi:MAG: transcriptional repressor [Candidatus Levybacteria bacterium]|nr:transcriptional repressor [Candidatus Levybacteria bacterium]
MFNLIKNHDCRQELKGFEVKATPARLAVMKFLESSNQPVDVNAILDYLTRESIHADPATIFRMMNAFVDKGILKKIDFREGKTRYELSSKGDHHHLVCTNCGNVERIEDSHMKEFEEEIKKKKKFLVKSHSLEFFGICQNCQS